MKINDFNKEQTIIDIPGMVKVHFYHADPVYRGKQNYPAYRMSDGSVPVLEAAIMLHAPVDKPFKQEMIIGFPLGMLPEPGAEHVVVLIFTKSNYTLYVDNKLVDNDFPIGYPVWSNHWTINPEIVKEAELCFPAYGVQRDLSKKLRSDIGYFPVHTL